MRKTLSVMFACFLLAWAVGTIYLVSLINEKWAVAYADWFENQVDKLDRSFIGSWFDL